MFRGTNAITMDSKNRITVPTKYRELLQSECAGKMVCTVDIQHECLLLYPLEEWQLIEEKLSALSSMNRSERLVQQVVLGNAIDCDMDKSGRLLLNGQLRKYAGLEKNIMLVGQFNKFEIWDEAKWDEHMHQGIDQMKSGELELTENLQGISF